MRLKKLKLSGFKSFAEKVLLDFDAAIIAIVGPNGCGKSNIVDAFRWVMGEQSAKSMRGEKMHDLLFAGTAKRPPLNYAEVSVTLTDVKEELPIPYEELQITRRLYRSGESEYLLNNNPIRLKELHHLFMGSGIGKNAFSIFEQGKLDQIIHLNPLLRRSIFDECAGIGRFLQRKKESLSNLEQVAANYQRVKDVHEEVEKSSRALKRQAVQAQNYQESKEKLEELEKAILVARHSLAADKEEGNFQEVVRKLQAVQKEICAQEKRIAAERETLEAKGQKIDKDREIFYKMQNRMEVRQVEQKGLQEKIKEARKREKNCLDERVSLQKKHKSYQEELARKRREFDEVEKRRVEQVKENAQRNKSFEELEKALQELLRAHREGQRICLQATQKAGELTSQLQRIKTREEACKERVKQLGEELSSKKERIDELEGEQKEKKKRVILFTKEIEKREEELRGVRQEIKTLQEKVENAQRDLEKAGEEIAELSARERSLIRLREEFEGFSKGAKELLKESRKKSSPLFGKVQGLFHYLTPKKGEERQTAHALRAYAHTLVVEKEADFHLVIEFAKQKKWTDFSLFTLERLVSDCKNPCSYLRPNLPDGQSAERAGSFKQAVKREREAQQDKDGPKMSADFCNQTLESGSCHAHFLQDLIFTDTLQKALGHVGKRGVRQIASADGYFIDQRSVVFCGSEKSYEGNCFLREMELEELTLLIGEKREKRDLLQTAFENLSGKKKQLEEMAKQLEEKRRKEEMHLVEANFLLQSLLVDIEREKERQRSLTEEERKALFQEKELEREKERFAGKLAELEEEKRVILEEIQAVEERLKKQQKSLDVEIKKKQEREQVLRELEKSVGRLQQEMEIITVKKQEISGREKRVDAELKASQKEAEECTALAQELSKETPLDIEKLKKELEEKERELAAGRKQLEDLVKSLSRIRQELIQLEKKHHTLELQRAERASIRKTIEEELGERFNLSIVEAEAQCKTLETSVEESQKMALRLRYEIERAGAINMASIEEFKEQEKRTGFLESQLKDLEEAKKDLEKVIATLEMESRKLFKKVFAQIREKFQKNFRILFEGGEADLTLTGGPDVLEAGVEITAKPPGKQMRSISLLSGGEKCLTALAVLFAIFEVRPSPFCVLDEVDAPLDDSNIGRFTAILKRFIDKTQFILVTHNKKTMACADILFGVSMEEKGVSKLLSLTFEKEKVTT